MSSPELIITLQQMASPALDTIFRVVTDLGHDYVYILGILVVFWCVDRRVGHHLSVLFLFSMWLNGLVKEVVASPRPSPAQGVAVMVEEDRFSFPSGHAQGMATFWGYLAVVFRSPLFRLFCVIAILLVGLSRVYLGVHFPIDVVGGFLIGAALVFLYVLYQYFGLGNGLPRALKVFLAIVVPLALIPIYQDKYSFQFTGFILGIIASNLFALEALPYNPRGGLLRQAIKLLIGLVGFGVLYMGVRLVPAGLPEALGYAVLAVWVTVLAPWLFIKLGLAQAAEPTGYGLGGGRRRFGARHTGSLPPFGSLGSRGPKFGRTTLDPSLRGVIITAAVVALVVSYGAYIAPDSQSVPVTAFGGRLMKDGTLVVGHRGAAGLAPENTLLSIETALDLGVDMVEIDVHLTADGNFAVIHDPTVDRTTDGTGVVAEMGWDELQQLDAGYRFSPDGRTFPHRSQGLAVPDLESVFEAFPQTLFLIEVKEDDPLVAERLAESIVRAAVTDRVIVAGAGDGVIKSFRSLLPTVPTGAARSEGTRFFIASRLGLDAFVKPQWDFLFAPPKLYGITVVTPGLIQAASRKGRDVYAWTINDPDHARELVQMGVRGIVTDFPDRIIPVVREIGEQ